MTPPFMLGIMASSGGAAGAYELIATVYPSGTSSVTFSSIPQNYKHLQIRAVTRVAAASAFSDIMGRINDNAGTAYSMHSIEVNGSTKSSFGLSAGTTNDYRVSRTPGTNVSALVFAGSIVDILDYTSSAKRHSIRTLAGHHEGSNYSALGVYSTAFSGSGSAITSLTFYANSGGSSTFIAGSRFSIYGIKG